MKKRLIALLVCVTLTFSSAIGRIGYIMLSGTYTVSDSYNSYSLVIDKIEPTMYYRNFEKLTNNKTSYVAVIRPNEKCLGELYKLFSYSEQKEIIEELKKGYPVVRTVESNVKTKYIKIYKTTSSYNTCNQFVSKTSNGMMSYSDLEAGERKVLFSIDAKGRLLSGDEGTIVDDNYDSKSGYVLSIDKEIQQITYEACANMKSGCAIVMNIEDCSILSAVSKPENTYLNKALQKYSVGSVFKIIVSASALENGVDLKYNCKGSIKVGDTVFSCQNNKAHATQSLKEALANSCNCYFVNLALNLGADNLLKTAEAFGFDTDTQLYDNWVIDNAVLPTKSELTSKGQLALFGFGQGRLTATPLQICSSLCTIANNGVYRQPRLVLSQVNDAGLSVNIKYTSESYAVSKETCQELIKYMRYVVTNGTGYKAETTSHKSAGKTATAQTGQYEDGVELLNTWFAGLYPYDNPKYAIVIMTEKGTSGSENCCPIFSTIVEKLETL